MLRKVFAVLAATVLAGIVSAQYVQSNLTSDGSTEANFTDSNLLNPWGLAFSPSGPFWIANNGTGTSTVYSGIGQPLPAGDPTQVTIPPSEEGTPTGLVYNDTLGFIIDQGGGSLGIGRGGPSTYYAQFIFGGQDGTISAWNPDFDATNAVTMIDNVLPGSSYTGVALARNGSQTYLYAANFGRGSIDVFDSNWNYIRSFSDPYLPPGYSPFNVMKVNNSLVVTFALRDVEGYNEVSGQGYGYVDVLSPGGHQLQRLISRGALNSPWGVALAPHKFGEFHDTLLIGNFGDGKINSFDPRSGRYLGSLGTRVNGRAPIVIPGLWGLAFGNGFNGSDPNILYFTAGIDGEAGGLFGQIAPAFLHIMPTG